MSKISEKTIVQLKYGLAFKKLLEENKGKKLTNKSAGLIDHKLVSSLGQLSSATGLRKATISEVFAGKTNPEGTTIDAILEGLGKTFTQFSYYYDGITTEELQSYGEEIARAKIKRQKKKKKAKK
jgi:transcriptional regulator with XRE-family HTH domain